MWMCVWREGGWLNGSQIHIERGGTSAFYQLGPDNVTEDGCLQIIGHWDFFKVVNC